MEAGMEATSELIASVHRPSAVVCSNDLTAIGVIRKASELSLNIPGDLSVVGFDDIRMAQFTTPRLITVQLPSSKSPIWRLERCWSPWKLNATKLRAHFIRSKRI
jgi:DNA-binding LacI/PurR family transcriptional regulator